MNSTFIKWKSEKEKQLSLEIHSNIPSISNLIDGRDSQFNCTPLEAMTYARQSCIYPSLLKSKITKMMNIGLINEEYSHGLIEGTQCSSKIDAVINTIKARKENSNNKIVFCHYRGEIDIIASRLTALGINVSKVDGRTSKKDRKENLTNAVDVLILQINTACEGLNLQDYNEIYFVSPHWNPAIEDQAIARCHRIGQRREVEVFRFQMSGSEFAATTDGEEDGEDDDCTKTLEEYCLVVQDNKRKMREIMIENHEINPQLPSDN
jgi:SNF2 family DNA or RNA helicase